MFGHERAQVGLDMSARAGQAMHTQQNIIPILKILKF